MKAGSGWRLKETEARSIVHLNYGSAAETCGSTHRKLCMDTRRYTHDAFRACMPLIRETPALMRLFVRQKKDEEEGKSSGEMDGGTGNPRRRKERADWTRP